MAENEIYLFPLHKSQLISQEHCTPGKCKDMVGS